MGYSWWSANDGIGDSDGSGNGNGDGDGDGDGNGNGVLVFVLPTCKWPLFPCPKWLGRAR